MVNQDLNNSDILQESVVQELYQALLLIKDPQEMAIFFKDLCTPQEIRALAERWRVCQLLHAGDLSYREINSLTGASLATVCRVARFLKEEPNHGYQLVLERLPKKTVKK